MEMQMKSSVEMKGEMTDAKTLKSLNLQNVMEIQTRRMACSIPDYKNLS